MIGFRAPRARFVRQFPVGPARSIPRPRKNPLQARSCDGTGCVVTSCTRSFEQRRVTILRPLRKAANRAPTESGRHRLEQPQGHGRVSRAACHRRPSAATARTRAFHTIVLGDTRRNWLRDFSSACASVTMTVGTPFVIVPTPVIASSICERHERARPSIRSPACSLFRAPPHRQRL